MKHILLSLFTLALLVPTAFAQAPTIALEAPKQPLTGVLSVNTIISTSALKWGVKRQTLERVIQCESGGNPDAIGDHGTSFGISQIHLSAHPNITKEEALDPVFSIDYLAKEISLGNGSMWTCY